MNAGGVRSDYMYYYYIVYVKMEFEIKFAVCHRPYGNDQFQFSFFHSDPYIFLYPRSLLYL